MNNLEKTTSKKLPVSILTLLVLEFIFGTLAGLYQEIPDGVARFEVYKPAGIIFFHVLIATALLVLATIFVIRSKRVSKKVFGASIGGLSCIVSALVSGVLFVQTGNDIFSFTMMLFAVGGLLSYAQIVFQKQL